MNSSLMTIMATESITLPSTYTLELIIGLLHRQKGYLIWRITLFFFKFQ